VGRIDREIAAYYERGAERERLVGGGGTLELVRTQELLRRCLPPPPAAVLDVGGGPGTYAAWLAGLGYRVHLVDPVPLHVEQATAAAAARPDHPFTAAPGDARRLDEADASFDAVLLLGPLYHLTERADRLLALTEARRVLRPGGVVAVVGISRFASLLDMMRRGLLGDAEAMAIIERDVRDGQHRNPMLDRYPGWFTTAFFHHPAELAEEVAAAGFVLEDLLGIEGPGAFVGDAWDDPEQREGVVWAARAVEREPSLLGLSAHLLAVGRKQG
jgi:SAM-dependent methyltransferase